MSHLAASLFFLGLIVALATLVQLTVRDHWDAIVAALMGREMQRAPVRAARYPAAARTPQRHAAA